MIVVNKHLYIILQSLYWNYEIFINKLYRCWNVRIFHILYCILQTEMSPWFLGWEKMTRHSQVNNSSLSHKSRLIGLTWLSWADLTWQWLESNCDLSFFDLTSSGSWLDLNLKIRLIWSKEISHPQSLSQFAIIYGIMAQNQVIMSLSMLHCFGWSTYHSLE